jgi:hypothetical protein
LFLLESKFSELLATLICPGVAEIFRRYCLLDRISAACAVSIAMTIAGTIVTPGSTFARNSFSMSSVFRLPRV